MGFYLLIFLIFSTLQPSKPESLEIKSAQLLDLDIRDYTFRSYNNSFKTGQVYTVPLPAHLSGINVASTRLRCGSLQRHGAKLKGFSIASGANVHPCITRVLLVSQTVGSNWTSLYTNTYELAGYQLVSPVLGLLAYTIGESNYSSTKTEIQIQTNSKQISIDFSSITFLFNSSSSGISPLCVSFDGNRKVTLWNQERPNVCTAKKNGHFGLVIESPLKGKVGKVKIVVVSSIGAALGAFLLSLLLIAMFVNAKKKKERMDELERRAYEEEALQVSMVGHVRAVTASANRAAPIIEHHHYRIPYS